MPPFADLRHGDCRDIIATLDDNSIDAIVTDPPYELGFMGKGWDNTGIAYDVNLWAECLRVLKPGGHLLAFGGTRTYHRMACAIEDAGFEIRDSIHWLYGSGFPKSHDVSKAIDKAAGATREVVGSVTKGSSPLPNNHNGHWHDGQKDGTFDITAPATAATKQWEGWGTALKPAHEPIVMARKSLIGTVAANVLQHGTGALNIDDARVGSDGGHAGAGAGAGAGARVFGDGLNGQRGTPVPGMGRWPANVILDEDAAAELDAQTGKLTSGSRTAGTYNGFAGTGIYGDWTDVPMPSITGNSGGASRFFYCAKASRAERNAGGTIENTHPTVKPLALMRYLVRLVTPPGGTVLEPFAGSGTTMAAAILEGFNVIGCELTADYLPIIEGRIAWAQQQYIEAHDNLFGENA